MITCVSLRPHHGLCLPNFQGRGYSDEFCANMTRMKEALQADPGILIRITEGADALCAHCPNRRGNACESVHPPVFDRHVLEHTDISYGDTMPWKEFYSRTRPLILNHLDTICTGCQWIDLCTGTSQ